MLPRIIIPLALLALLTGAIVFFTRSNTADPAPFPPLLPANPSTAEHSEEQAPGPAIGPDATPEAPADIAPTAIPEEAREASPEDSDESMPRPLRPEDVLEFEEGPDGSLRPRGPI
jgi:hypothetical protein